MCQTAWAAEMRDDVVTDEGTSSQSGCLQNSEE